MTDLIEVYPQLQNEEAVLTYDFDTCWCKTHPKEAFEELDVAMAILRTRANYGKMAKLLGRARSLVRNHVERNMPLRDLFNDVWEAFLDEIEDKHKDVAMNGDIGTQRFFLVTRGKDRGYVTRSEATGKDGRPLEATIKITEETSEAVLEELMALRDAKDKESTSGGP